MASRLELTGHQAVTNQATNSTAAINQRIMPAADNAANLPRRGCKIARDGCVSATTDRFAVAKPASTHQGSATPGTVQPPAANQCTLIATAPDNAMPPATDPLPNARGCSGFRHINNK